MKNFKNNNIGKKTWGVLGKQQTYYYQPGLAQQGEKTPLNADAFVAWDYKKSKYKRIDLMPRQMENDGQQAGVVPQVTSTPVPDVSPTPTPSFTPTATVTPTMTVTPTITPSSTPYPLPETPALWYDSTNLGSIDYITSGGTDYVSTWRSIGTYQKAVSGSSINNMPIWSGSSRFPDSPLIVRFTKTSNTALINWLSQRFDSTPIPQSGITVFQVVANPAGGSFVFGSATSFLYSVQFLSGNTTTGGFTPPLQLNYSETLGNPGNGFQVVSNINGIATTNSVTSVLTGNAINNMFLYHQSIAQASGSSPFTLNNTGSTLTLPITGTNVGNITSVSLGAPFASGGTVNTTILSSVEMGEVMMFNRVLTVGETTQVINYLKDKWKYTSW
jgi:hypothetical protein